MLLRQVQARSVVRRTNGDIPAVAILRERLRARGFVQLPHESFAETMGRAFGMRGPQLRAYLEERAYGH
jgi:hypothetical protein